MADDRRQRAAVNALRLLVAATVILLAAAYSASAAGTPATRADEASAPTVFAAFTTDEGAKGIREARLFVDGRDVTGQSTVTALRVAYRPDEPLSAGDHLARVVVVDALGRSWTKDWTFSVAPGTPALETVWSEALLVELERLPRQTRDPRIALRGWTQPLAEVSVRVDGAEVERVLASSAGRFDARIPLELGDQSLALAARSLETGDEGPELALRIERLPAAGDDPQVDLPRSTRLPGLELRPRLIAGAARPDRLEATPRLPDETDDDEVVASRPPREPIGRAPSGDGARDGEAPTDGASVPDGGVDLPGDDDPDAVVAITKPDDGEVLRHPHATVLGRAPAGWSVTLMVDGGAAGADVANPAGHFTIPNVPLGEGPHVLVARATQDGEELLSEPVNIQVEGTRFMLAPAPLVLTQPQRGSAVARASVQRVSGVAWEGAEIEVDVNGRIVARDVAGLGGRFDLDVPLEPGLNVLLVEASSPDGARMVRSREHAISAPSRVRSTRIPPQRIESSPRAPVVGQRPPRPGIPSRLP